MLYFLVGFMGAGKSTLAKEIAQLTGYKFVDTDTLLEEKQQLTIPQYFEKFGETAFRKEETLILQNLSTSINAIVATGGGLPCFNGNMEWMNANGITIYIKQSTEELIKRLENTKPQRPLLQGVDTFNFPNHIKGLIELRKPYYELATHTFDGPMVSPQTVINTVIPTCA